VIEARRMGARADEPIEGALSSGRKAGIAARVKACTRRGVVPEVRRGSRWSIGETLGEKGATAARRRQIV
jgi:hypothetical protein